MDHTEKYKDLEIRNKKLEKELEILRSKLTEATGPELDVITKSFRSSGNLMILSKLEDGSNIDVNTSFLNTLGFTKEEVIGKTADDLGLYTDSQANKRYIKLLSKYKRIKDFYVTLRARNGEEKQFLYSADSMQIEDKVYYMSTYTPLSPEAGLKIGEEQSDIIKEIFNTVSSYLILFKVGPDNRFYITDINNKVEEVELVSRNEVLGKCIEETPLRSKIKLAELLNRMYITKEALKVETSPQGDDSQGYYIGFLLTSGNMIITWEPGQEQKIREDISRQSALFRKFAEMLPGIIYELDLEGKILYGNQLGLDVFGFTREDIARGKYISDVFPESYQKMLSNLESLKSPGEISSNEYYVTRKDGSLIPIVTHSFAIFHNGQKIGYRGTVTDVSKHRKYEEQIVREKAFLEYLIDSTPEAIAITDLTGKITLINKEFSNLFGYTSEEAAGRNIDDLVVPDDLKEEAFSIEKEIASEHRKVVKETIRKDKYGNKIEVSLIATSVVVNNEPIANVGIYRNITVEKKNQLLQEVLYNISSAALKQMDIKEIYPIIVQELSKIWDTNNFFIALYDKTSDTMSLPFFADEKDKFSEIPTKGTISGYVIRNNKPVLLRENDLKLLEESGNIDLVGTPCKVWMGVPMKVEDETIGIMCLQDYNNEDKFSQDDLYVLNFIANQIAIALQRRIMLDNLIFARQRAEEAAQSKQIFMSTMSHEIRTPLNEVIGITNLLMQGNPREDQMDYLKTLKFSGNHLLTLVNDVLDYNKMESGKIVFEKVQFNINDFLDEIMRSYSFRSKAKNLTFEIKHNGNLPLEVIGDQIRLNQILSNLLSNALKFTNHGGITVTIRETERKGNQSKLEFQVTDTGIGISKEKHAEIFESFTQASSDTSRRFGGSGLGLAICKKLIELQGGSISLDSEINQGSTFSFILTFEVADRSGKGMLTETTESYKGLEGKRILVAEDNKINFFVANKFLTGWGVIVSHAENGKLAIEQLEKEDFDLVLMDLHMPVMDGIEATRIIRNSSDPRIRSVPIVALTAAIMSENHDKIDELNINDYVLKPFRPHDLFSRILKNVR